MKLAVLGAGAWGTALAIAFSSRHSVTLWGRDAGQLAQVAAARENTRYLPGYPLPQALRLQPDLAAALADAELALLVVPSAGLRTTLEAIAAHRAGLPVVWACKGFEPGSAKLPHQVVQEAYGTEVPAGVLSGPSFAQEVAAGKPAALTLASRDAAFAQDTARALHGSRLRVYSSTDVVGVELGGALKNVMAIAAGISDGMALGHNARAALITRGLAEIARLGQKLGGQAETFMGLTGLGDLVLTCTGDLSRNRRVGLELARGASLPDILQNLGHVAEGVHTAREALKLARAAQVEMPITEAVCAVLAGSTSPAAALDALLTREPRPESQ